MNDRILGSLFAATLLVSLATACGGDDTGLTSTIPERCNALGGVNCITPFPSAIYEVEDSTTRTGMRLDIAEGALPTSSDDITVESAPYNEHDGFSVAAPMIAAFEEGVDGSNLVHYSDYPASITDASPTILIDMDTGERVVHFAELDVNAAGNPETQALYIRPAARLKGSTRYAVGIRKTLKALGGGDLAMSPGFAAILSGETTNHDLLERVRPRYDAIFAAFDAQGISRDDLIVAWDFTTASDDSVRIDLLTARDRAMVAAGDAGKNLDFTLDRDEPSSDERIRRRLEGTFDSPLFLSQDGRQTFQTELVRDADGLPELQGMYRAPFVAIVPECAYDVANQPVGMIIYGHGLFGSPNEVGSGSQRAAADVTCRIVIGTAMHGMSEKDVGSVARALNNFNLGPQFFEVIIQGLIDTVALEHIIRGPMAERLFVDDQGVSIVDSTDVVYLGNSQGHIFGSTFMAIDPFIERGVFGVGGANYSMMLERSADWPTYGVILKGAYPNSLDVSIGLSLVQMGFDLTDPVSTMNDMFTGGIPGTPAKHMLLHMAVGDHQVPNISTEYQARSMGLSILRPAVYVPYGIPEASGPLTDGLVIFDDGAGIGIQPGNEPPVGTDDPHGMPRSQPAAQRQMRTFYNTGEVMNTCGDKACICKEPELACN